MFKPADLFDLTQTAHAAIFDGCEYAWDALKKIQAYLEANLQPGLHNRCEGVAFVGERVFIGDIVLAELSWVLTRALRLPRQRMIDAVTELLATPLFAFEDRDAVEVALAGAAAGGAGLADH